LKGERLIEVNLLDQTSDLYGQEIAVQFVARVRGDHTLDLPMSFHADCP
jgi:FAD synthase